MKRTHRLSVFLVHLAGVFGTISDVRTRRNSIAQIIPLNVIVDFFFFFQGLLSLPSKFGNLPLIINKKKETKEYFQKLTENRKIL